MSFYSTVVLITVMLSIIMIVQINNSNIVTANAQKGFSIGFSVIMSTALLEWLTYFASGNPSFPRMLHGLCSSLEFSLAPAVVVVWIYAIGNLKRIHMALIFLLVHAILEFISAFTGFIFYINDNNVFCLGDYYYIYIMFYTVAIIAMFVEAYHFSRRYQNRNLTSLLATFSALLVGVYANSMDSTINTSWLAVAVCCVMFYIYYIELVVQSDGLTSLLNRRSYERHLAKLDSHTAIIIFDIDQFKKINDTYGHAYGDAVLKKISRAILSCYHSRGLCYRIGGDEFCVILNKKCFDTETCIIKLNQHFAHSISKLRQADPTLPTVSVGYEIFDGNNKVEDIIHNADTMMYTNKNNNR